MPIFWSKLGERPDFLSYVCLCVLFRGVFVFLLHTFAAEIEGCTEHATVWQRNMTASFVYWGWKLNMAPGEGETLSIARGDTAKR